MKIGEAINEARSWSSTESLNIDPKKSELLNFSRRHQDKDKKPQVTTNEFTISVDQSKSFKSLRIYFDRKLKFQQHACIQAAKALKVPNALRSFGNTIRGVNPKLSKQVTRACILPIAHFGAQTWWPGKNRVKGYRIISGRKGTYLNMIDKAHRAAARAIFPVYCTAPSTALYGESALSPAELTLDFLTKKAAMRKCRLDSYNLLHLRSYSLTPGLAVTRLTRSLKMLPPFEEVDPLFSPP